MVLLAAVQLDNPLIWAIIIGWILSVVLHEFAHGLVGYLGGDYTIKERGGLTLNPIQYIHPIYSIALPILFLIMGGVPLPGGATYIRRDLLRSRGWDSAVAAAGPVMNFILFVLCALPFHPTFGWINTQIPRDQYQPWQIFLGAMAVLQITAVCINLIPIPPLDGFNIIGPYLNPETRQKLVTPPISTFVFFAFFMILANSPLFGKILIFSDHLLRLMRFDASARMMILRCFFQGVWGVT